MKKSCFFWELLVVVEAARFVVPSIVAIDEGTQWQVM
jgi:hypothetical protein